VIVNVSPIGLPLRDRARARDVRARGALVVTSLASTSEPSARGQHAAAPVALAPAAMAALIEAQEDAGAPAIVRVQFVQVIGLDAARQQLRQAALQPAAHQVDIAA
jgi:hypothetical protein